MNRNLHCLLAVLACGFANTAEISLRAAQTTVPPSVFASTDDELTKQGSITAKGGFRNEDEIRDKFNHWKTDPNSMAWLMIMGHDLQRIESVHATKPHGYKADVEVIVRTKSQSATDRLSIKLVSSAAGFNQIDKRWLKTYSEMWKMPPNVVAGLKLYLGELPPTGLSRRSDRMYLNEISEAQRNAIILFFQSRKNEIVSDLIRGDGEHSANWFMVTQKATENPRWVLRPTADVVQFFSEGPVQMTRSGNLKIGRISMQRKGGDNGRETARMLQFKMNPALLFSNDK
ncbi:MAG: type II restriction endonuclease [Fuerstiella sp.]